jgi:MFS family permease
MSNSAETPKSRGGGLLLAVVYITALFFIWAFVTNLIDPLVKSMKVIYTLTDAEAQLNQFAFFIAYGIMSIPSGAYLAKKGYAKSIILGLSGIVAGCLIAWSTTYSHTFITVLLGLFVAASGITLLQVAANPLIASMGDQKRTHFRLNLSQAFNSMGAFLGGMFGSKFLLSGPLFEKGVVVTDAMKATGLGFVTNVYLMVAGILAVFTLAVFLVRNTISTHSPKMAAHTESPFSAFKSKWSNLGSLGIFLYVGAEVCVISGMIFFLEQPQIMNIPSQVAGFRRSGLHAAGHVRPVHRFLADDLRQGDDHADHRGAGRDHPVHHRHRHLPHARDAARRRLPDPDLPRRLPCAADHGLPAGIRRHPDRAVQLDHVPDHLHPDARAFHRPGIGDLGPDVHGHFWRRVHLGAVRFRR